MGNSTYHFIYTFFLVEEQCKKKRMQYSKLVQNV